MILTDTLLEDDLWDFVQEAAGDTQVIRIPMRKGGVRPSEDHIAMQLLDSIPEGREEIIYQDDEGKFAIKQYYSIRFSFKGFGRTSKLHLSNVLLRIYRDPDFVSRMCNKNISALGNPSIIDITELLSTEFESRCQARPSFLVPVILLSDISCIEHINFVETSYLSIGGEIVHSSQIQVDKPTT